MCFLFRVPSHFLGLAGHVDDSGSSVFLLFALVMLGLKLETQHKLFAPKANPVTFKGDLKNVTLFLKPIKFPHSRCPN